MKKMWTIWFVCAAVATIITACGSEETRLSSTRDDSGSDSGTFQPNTGEGTDAGTPAREEDASAPADAGTQTDGQTTDAEQPAQGSDASETEQPQQDAGTGQTGTDAGVVQVPTNTDVVKVNSACQMQLSSLYVSGATSGELRGSIPGVMTWDSGPAVSDSDADGYLEFNPASLPIGTFDLSYLGDGNWALYGAEAQLQAMSAAARAFVSCNWFDGTNIVAVASPECHLRIKVETGCLVSGAGNMANLQ